MVMELQVPMRGLLRLLVLPCALPWTKGGKVLVFPVEGSHWLNTWNIVKELHAPGHQAVVLAPEVTVYTRGGGFFNLKTYTIPYAKEEYEYHLQVSLVGSLSNVL